MEQKLKSVIFFIVVGFIGKSESQFNYPADENAPAFETEMTCFACEGEGCDGIQSDMIANNTQTCKAARVGCWTLRNMNTGVYSRSCSTPAPASIRQGVFCNRHIDNREFCFGIDGPNGRERVCAKCCLNERCNFGVLEGEPHRELQTCVACDGSNNELCNEEQSVRQLEESFHTEQCLFPRSDCWKERRVVEGKATYVRGCQLLECDEHNIKENCTFHESINEEKCTKCCENNLCNRLQFEKPFNAAVGQKTSSLSFVAFLFLSAIVSIALS